MKNSVCPACGKKYSFREYQKNFWGQQEKWSCDKCNTLFTFHKGRHKILLIMTILPFPYISMTAHELMANGMSLYLAVTLCSLFFFVLTIVLYLFEKISIVDQTIP